MSQLLSTQPSHDPIEFTHFDQWFEVSPEFEGEEGAGAAEFDNADIEQRAEKLAEVLAVWEETLGDSFSAFLLEFDSLESVAYHMGWDNLLDLIVFNILRAGYDVYVGDGFIEIYKGEA